MLLSLFEEISREFMFFSLPVFPHVDKFSISKFQLGHTSIILLFCHRMTHYKTNLFVITATIWGWNFIYKESLLNKLPRQSAGINCGSIRRKPREIVQIPYSQHPLGSNSSLWRCKVTTTAAPPCLPCMQKGTDTILVHFILVNWAQSGFVSFHVKMTSRA